MTPTKAMTSYAWGMGWVVKGLIRRRTSFTRLASSKEALAAFDRGLKCVRK